MRPIRTFARHCCGLPAIARRHPARLVRRHGGRAALIGRGLASSAGAGEIKLTRAAGGITRLVVPTSAGPTLFTVGADATVSDVLADVGAEAATEGGEDTAGAAAVDGATPWANLLQLSSFSMSLGGESFVVRPPPADDDAGDAGDAGDADAGEGDGGDAQAASAAQIACLDDQAERVVAAAPVLQLRLALQADRRFAMPCDEFHALCKAHGAAGNDAEAAELLTDFHEAGVVFNWPEGKHGDTVFLKPIEVADAAFAALGLPGPTRHSADRMKRGWRAELAAVDEELGRMVPVHERILARARTVANVWTWGGFGALLAGTGFYWWLSYVYFSWDIMEPVTYFTAGFFSIVGFWWYLFSNTDYEYENLYAVVRARSVRKQREKAGFDGARFEALLEEKGELEGHIARAMRTLSYDDGAPIAPVAQAKLMRDIVYQNRMDGDLKSPSG